MTTKLTEFARELRENSTDAERLFWSRVRAHRLLGFKFKRQYTVGLYIVDFVCVEARLIVELDGGQHATSESDQIRDARLTDEGYRVLRFWNNDVLLNIDGVIETVLKSLGPSPQPSPTTGEGVKSGKSRVCLVPSPVVGEGRGEGLMIEAEKIEMNQVDPSLDLKALLANELNDQYPDARGRFGPFGGAYVPETLMPALNRLKEGVKRYLHDPEFLKEFHSELKHWIGRPTPLTYAGTLAKNWGAQVWLKREDLAHTGAHKINNSIGQVLLAKKLGAKRVVAETGAGQHGVASAAACARLNMPCTVYMGAVDMERQAPNVGRMKLLGATVVPVTSGDKTLRAAVDEALRDWVTDPNGTYYCLGSAIGPHPYPYIVRELQSVIGRETREQILALTGSLPDIAIACVGGGSNAIGMFHPFLKDASVQLLGLEAGGKGNGLGENAASISFGTPGVLQGCYSLLLQDENGQIQETHSVSAGLDYPGVGPEHALLGTTHRVKYEAVSDDEALAALAECCRSEGILPAIESAHALAGARRWAKQNPGKRMVICLSGRGDKDMPTLQQTILKGLI